MLYSFDRERREKLSSKKREQERELAERRSKVLTDTKSRAMIEEMKVRHFSEIFHRLDSDRDG
jgi:hypothetical protein